MTKTDVKNDNDLAFTDDPVFRKLLETLCERELRGAQTVSYHLIESSDRSRVTVDRCIAVLVANWSLVKTQANSRVTYVTGANGKTFCDELAEVVA